MVRGKVEPPPDRFYGSTRHTSVWWRYVVLVKADRPKYRGIAPLIAGGSEMSSREYEEWHDTHLGSCS